MKKIISACGREALALAALTGAALLLPATVSAEASPFSANAALTTDYVWRGVSQTLEDPAIQGGFDFNHDSGFYAGVWGSNVDFGGDEHLELDYYAGFAGETGGIGYDLGILYYDYFDDTDTSWPEIYAKLSYDFDVAALEGGIAYSDDVGNSGTDEIYYHVSASVPLGSVFSLGATVAYQDLDEEFGESYTHWQLGVGASYGGLDFDVSYHDTDLDDNELAEERVVFTVSKSF